MSLSLSLLSRPAPSTIALAVLLQVLCIALPNLWSVQWALLLSGGLLVLGFAAFSVRRTLALTLFLTIVLPDRALLALILPGGLRFQEGLLLAAGVFALIDLFYRRPFALRPSGADGPVLVFLGATLLSVGVGVAHDNSTSQILRDMRFPFYYAAFFLYAFCADGRDALRFFLPVLVLAALVVSVEYILEFLGAIDLSTDTRFVRVARLHGLSLPLALLFIANQLIHDPQRYGRPVLVGLMLPIGLAFVLTVGRGMWVAVGVGVVVSVLLHYYSLPQARRSAWRALWLVLGLLAVVVGAAVAFQQFTGAAIGAHALERSLTFVDYQRDAPVLVRLLSYGAALEAIVRHPLLGHGQGAVLALLSLDPITHLPERMLSWTLDSLYLTLLWKMGLVGLLAFAWMGWRVLRLARQTFRASAAAPVRAFAGGAVAVLCGMAVLGLSDASMVNGRFALVYALLFGMVAAVAREEGVR